MMTKHWIYNTKLAKKCKENEKTRKMVAILMMIIICVLIIGGVIGGYGKVLDYEYELAGAKGVNDWNKINYFEGKIMYYKIQMGISIIVAILIWHYGKKIVEKK